MHDESGAQRAPDESSRSIMLADSGDVAAQPPALGHDHPDATPSPTVSEHNRPGATPLPTVPEHDRPGAMPSPPVPGYDRSGASIAAVSVPDHSPVSPPPAAGHDCSRRASAAAGSPSASVTQSTTLEETVYDRTCTKEEVQRLVQAATAPLLDEELRLLQVLIQRVVATGYDPTPPPGRQQDAPTVRQQQRAALLEKLAVVGRAVDVLQRTLKTRQALASDSASALFQLLDEAAKYMDGPPPPPADQPADEHGDQHAPPSPPSTCTPL